MTDRIKALEDALRKLELANDRVCGARPQRVYNLMIAGGMTEALLDLDCARADARAALAASQPAPTANDLIRRSDAEAAFARAWANCGSLTEVDRMGDHNDSVYRSIAALRAIPSVQEIQPAQPVAVHEAAKNAVQRAIDRLRNLHSYAGRPAWDEIVAEEMTAALSALMVQPAHFASDGNEEARWIESCENACGYCGGSGHKGDVQPITVQDAERDAELLLSAYKGLLVLHRIMVKAGLHAGEKTTSELADRIVSAHPEFPARAAMRAIEEGK